MLDAALRPIITDASSGGSVDIDQILDDIQPRFILSMAGDILVTMSGDIIFDGNND